VTAPDFVCEVYCELSPCSGTWNMAFDEALLERCLSQNVCHVRLYRWQTPTVSLGYFQDYHPETIPENLRSLEVVRRLSGGGAILHHHELTYSCSVPPEHPLAKAPMEIYRRVHACLIEILQERGVVCAMRGAALDFPQGEPFLCYSRGDEHDVLCQGQKIIGSAQRRRRGAVLQHGSVLLKRSVHAPQFLGVEDFYPRVTFSETADLCDRLARIFGRPASVVAVDDSVESRAKILDAEKYSFPSRRFEPDLHDERSEPG
jgi:lipoyl(octanoyl) transferase